MQLVISNTTPQEVQSALKTTGSTDADVLFAAKTELGRPYLHQRTLGLVLIVAGLLVALAVSPILVGIPVAAGGIWMFRKGVRNLTVVEAAYTTYVASTPIRLQVPR